MINDKKQPVIKSPNLAQMQEVVINRKTRIYIEAGADPEEAKERYFARLEMKKP